MLSRNIILLYSRILANSSLAHCQKNFINVNNFSVFANHVRIIYRPYSNINPNTTSEEQYKEITITNLNEFKSKNCPAIKYISPKLQKFLGLTSSEVKELIKKYPALKNTVSDTLEKNYNICKEAEISNEILLQYPVILTLDLLKIKVEYLQEVHVDINLIAPLLLANIKVLRTMVENMKVEEKEIPYRNRIVYLSKTLKLPAPEICEKIIHHTYVLRIQFERLASILKVLLDFGVEPRNILNDCWALRYSPQIAEERLQKAIKSNVVKVKTWMIRCPDKVLKRCITRQMENRTILGNNSSVEEYLSKRLECSIENAKYLTEKYPAIGKMNSLKMKEILDFLYEQGYSPTHVCRVPRILVHSQETTKLRIQQLRQIGFMPPTLAILCKSKKDFDKILKKYSKRKICEKNSNEE